MKHYNWLHSRLNKVPVFSPDGTVKTPLIELYLRLRCYWHSKIVEDDDKDGKTKESLAIIYQTHAGDLHEEIEKWLDGPCNDRIRVVAGGPGSGKSSFAKTVASELAFRGKYRVIFVELQRVILTDRLAADIGDYLVGRDGNAEHGGSPGFQENPLVWLRKDGRPALIIFDGLDELTHDDVAAKQKARGFILQAKTLVADYKADGLDVRVLILGRNLSCQDGIKAAGLSLNSMLNVAPIRALEDNDFELRFDSGLREPRYEIRHPKLSDEFRSDQRPTYWEKWALSQNLADRTLPEAVTSDSLSDLNVEPLLLHLLILSDFCGKRWKEAAENRNLVYEDLLNKIYNRNAEKRNNNPVLEYYDFMLLMECLGLTAWRGNGRVGNEVVFEKIKEVHARHRLRKLGELGEIDMDSVVLQTHARRIEGDVPGFEFIHKTFGEYLTARGLVSLALRSAALMTNADYPSDEETVAKDWASVIFDAELTREVIRFVKDEARRVFVKSEYIQCKSELERLMAWTVRNGFPISGKEGGSFRNWETRQRCADCSLLVVSCAITSAMNVRLRRGDPRKTFFVDWGDVSAIRRLHAMGVSVSDPISLGLEHVNFDNVTFFNAYLAGSQLRGASLKGVNLSEADMRHSDMRDCNLGHANLDGIHLEGTDLRNADLPRAIISNAFLIKVNLFGANFDNAVLERTNLTGACLDTASFKRANFDQSILISCSAYAADFTECEFLTQKQVDTFFGVRSGFNKTLLPSDLLHPAFWLDADGLDKDTFTQAYTKSLTEWRSGKVKFRRRQR